MKLQKLSRAEHDRLQEESYQRLYKSAMKRKKAGIKPHKLAGALKGKLIVVGDYRKVFNLS